MPSKHSSIGASIASRWFECPGSVALVDLAPPQETSVYASQGIAAHWLLDQYFKNDEKIGVLDLVNAPKSEAADLENEDIDSVQLCIDFISELRKERKYILHTEAAFKLDKIHANLYGTADIVLIESNMKRLKVIDYKHGSGVPVNVENNKQLMYYALGAIQYVYDKHKMEGLELMGWGGVFNEVEIIIVQPRCRHKDGAVRRWVVPTAVLDAFADELKIKATETEKENAPLVPGTHCRFCPALAICPAFPKHTLALAERDFKKISDPQNLNLPVPESMTETQITKVLSFSDIIQEWLKAVEAHALQIMERGGALAGYKLVKKRANRRWVSEEKAHETLSLVLPDDVIYEKKIISPSQAEKLLKKDKKIIEALSEKPDNGNTIAPEHDPRPAVSGTLVTDFEAL